jgi:ubiquinol-cytochrome c reductase cytochrome c subunit
VTVRRLRPPRHLLALACPLLVAAAFTPVMAGRPSQGDDGLVDKGRELYESGCANCHGTDGVGRQSGRGEAYGPSLEAAGAASAYYELTTGRMPLAATGDQPVRKEPAYTREEIDALVAYVASIGNGPALPDIDTRGADVAQGGQVFRANCQPCHSASGSGGALSYGRSAPGLGQATVTEVGAAVRAGPGQMPVFGTDVISPEELDDLARYVEYLHNPEDPGGVPIGRTGPIPEGFVAWLVGIPALLLLVAWIGTRAPIRRRHP